MWIFILDLTNIRNANFFFWQPYRCGISRCWLESMITAQVCLRLATIKGHSKMCSFTVLLGSGGVRKPVSIWCDYHLPHTEQHISFAYSWSGCWLWPVECWSTPLQWLCGVAGYWQELEHAAAHPHDAIHTFCHLPCTVKTGIHPWREHLSKVPDAIEFAHSSRLRRRTAVRSRPRWGPQACRWASLRWFLTVCAEILWLCKPIVAAVVRVAGLRRSWRWRCWMWRSWPGVVTRGLWLRGRLDILPNSLKSLWRQLMVEKLTFNSRATALVDIPAVSMPIARSLKNLRHLWHCAVIKLHILEWPFIVASLRHTCAIIMLSNQHLDMPHLWGGWIISAKEKCSLTDLDRFVNNILTVYHRSEYTPYIFVNILLYLFMWQHWRNYLLQCSECTACITVYICCPLKITQHNV